MQITSILKICLGIMLSSGRSLAGPAYSTAPPEIWDQCPKPPGEFPLLLPNPVDCGSFYECSWSTAYLLQCPPTLHFNPTKQVCDYPSAANCVITTTTTPVPVINITTTHAPVINTTTTHVPIINTTTTHAPVINRTTTHAPVINTTTTHAPVINITTTHAPVINTTTTHVPVINTTTTHAPVINTTTTHAPVINITTTHAPVINTTTTHAPVINTTTTHVPLINTTTTTTSTTTTHAPVFNVTSDPPFHTSSTTTTSTTTKPSVITAPPEVAAQCPPYTLNHVAHIPNPDDCTTFYSCLANGWAILQQCPPGLHFNPTLKVCDDPSSAGCHLAK